MDPAADPQPTATAAMLSELAQAEALIKSRLREGDPKAAEAWEKFKNLREAIVKLGVKGVPPLLRDTDIPREFQIQVYTVHAGKATHRPEWDTPKLSAPQTMDVIRGIERAHHASGVKGEFYTDDQDGQVSRFEVFKYPPGAYSYPTEADPVDAVAIMICPLISYWKAEFSTKEAGAVFTHRPEIDFGPAPHESLNRHLAEIETAWRARGAVPQYRIEDATEQVIRYVIPEDEALSRPEEALEIRITEIPPLVGEAA